MPELTRFIISCPGAGCSTRISVQVPELDDAGAFHEELRRQVLMDGWWLLNDVPYCNGCMQ